MLSTLAYSRSLTAKLQGTIIGSNAARPAKQVCGLYVTTANPACTARHHQDSSALSSASVSEAPSPGEQLISTGVDQAHKEVAHPRPVHRLVEERVFAMQNRLLQGAFGDVVVEGRACLPQNSVSFVQCRCRY